MMKKAFIAIILLALRTAACAEECVGDLTYAVFPYLPDAAYYRELIENRWAELEPGIKLVRAEWDCYDHEAPEGIDVIMYDAVERDRLIANGWIQPISPNAAWDHEDIFPFAFEGFTVENDLYGIPVFLCGNFLIYDRQYEALSTAEHMTDLADEIGILVVNSENPQNRRQYVIETVADERGEANPSVDGSAEACLPLIDRLAVDAHKQDEDDQVVMAYDSGVGRGYIGFSESMRFLRNRADQTSIKAISFSSGDNIPRVYADAAAVTANARGQRYEKCLKLINVMAEASVMTALSVQEGEPQYLLLARRSPYQPLANQFPLYTLLEQIASDEENHVILTP